MKLAIISLLTSRNLFSLAFTAVDYENIWLHCPANWSLKNFVYFIMIAVFVMQPCWLVLRWILAFLFTEQFSIFNCMTYFAQPDMFWRVLFLSDKFSHLPVILMSPLLLECCWRHHVFGLSMHPSICVCSYTDSLLTRYLMNRLRDFTKFTTVSGSKVK